MPDGRLCACVYAYVCTLLPAHVYIHVYSRVRRHASFPTHIVLAHIAMAHMAMAHTAMAHTAMANTRVSTHTRTSEAYVVMACIVMDMAYIVMA